MKKKISVQLKKMEAESSRKTLVADRSQDQHAVHGDNGMTSVSKREVLNPLWLESFHSPLLQQRVQDPQRISDSAFLPTCRASAKLGLEGEFHLRSSQTKFTEEVDDYETFCWPTRRANYKEESRSAGMPLSVQGGVQSGAQADLSAAKSKRCFKLFYKQLKRPHIRARAVKKQETNYVFHYSRYCAQYLTRDVLSNHEPRAITRMP